MKVALLSVSKKVTRAVLLQICEALQLQMQDDVAPSWQIMPPAIFVPSRKKAPAGSIPFVFFDTADQAGALGYHDLDPNGVPYVRVFVDPVLEAGGSMLGPGDAPAPIAGYSVSSVASHEMCELVRDPFINLWADGPIKGSDGRQYASVADEACDPVQGFGYLKTLKSGPKVMVSDFITDAWFDPQATRAMGPFDFLGLLDAPFQIASGGYAIVRDQPGGEIDVWGSVPPPAWRMHGSRFPAARTYQRLQARVQIGGVTVERRGDALFWTSGLQVDADGASTAYAPAGSGLQALDSLGNAGRPGDWWGVVTDTGEPDGEPLVQGPDDLAPGYLISTTALQDHSRPLADPRRYVDSSQVPYLAVPPELLQLGVHLGDVALVRDLMTGKSSPAIVADVGPHKKLGEGSIALAEALSLNPAPRSGGVRDGVATCLFLHSHLGHTWPRSLSDIFQQVAELSASLS